MTLHVFVDNDPEHDGPTTVEIPYSDLDDDTLFELVMQGDQGAIDYFNEDRAEADPEDQ